MDLEIQQGEVFSGDLAEESIRLLNAPYEISEIIVFATEKTLKLQRSSPPKLRGV